MRMGNSAHCATHICELARFSRCEHLQNRTVARRRCESGAATLRQAASKGCRYRGCFLKLGWRNETVETRGYALTPRIVEKITLFSRPSDLNKYLRVSGRYSNAEYSGGRITRPSV